jgi:hypothetical protein
MFSATDPTAWCSATAPEDSATGQPPALASCRVKDTDLDRVYPHLVRKTVATLIEREEGLAAASHQLGHAAEAVTAAHYVAHRTVAPDHRNVLDQLLILFSGAVCDGGSDGFRLSEHN